MFYRFARVVVSIIFHLIFRIKTEGKENLPKNRGYIIASNHRTNADPVFIGISIRPVLTFMAKIELFRIPVLGHLFYWLGAFPVDRGKGDTGAIDFAIKTVKTGKVLAMFPEGTRSKDGKLMRIKSGCTIIASATGADVVPVAICFGKKLRPFSTITVKFGKPISKDELGVMPSAPSTIKEGNKLIGQRIAQMLDA